MITLRKFMGFAQNRSHSIAFVSLHKHMLPKTCILRWNIMFYNENTWFFETFVYFIEQKWQFFAKLIDYAEITYFLTVIINYGEIKKFSLKTNVFLRNGNLPEEKFYLTLMITLRKFIVFRQNKSHSIAFVSLFKYVPRTCIFRWNHKFYIEKPCFFVNFVS